MNTHFRRNKNKLSTEIKLKRKCGIREGKEEMEERGQKNPSHLHLYIASVIYQYPYLYCLYG